MVVVVVVVFDVEVFQGSTRKSENRNSGPVTSL